MANPTALELVSQIARKARRLRAIKSPNHEGLYDVTKDNLLLSFSYLFVFSHLWTYGLLMVLQIEEKLSKNL